MLSIVAGAAEADDPQATIGMGNVPAGATGIVPRVVPGTAAHHFIFVPKERGLVIAVWIGLIPVRNPFPDIPCHIAGTVGAGPAWEAPRRGGESIPVVVRIVIPAFNRALGITETPPKPLVGVPPGP